MLTSQREKIYLSINAVCIYDLMREEGAYMKKKTWGIILIVIGIMAFLGCLANGTFASYATGIALSDIVTILLMIGAIIGGIFLIIKGKNK